MNKVITLGREFGSGGRELARELAKILGFEFYDKEILREISKKTSLSEQYVKDIVENNPHEVFPITVAHTFSYIDSYAIQQKQNVFSEQEKVIKEMAERSNCIIVGRCADYILREYNPLRLFVYADLQCKIDRCMARNKNEKDLTENKVRKYIKSVDKARGKYYKFYTGEKWGDVLNYDIMINTTNVDIKKLAQSIAGLIK